MMYMYVESVITFKYQAPILTSEPAPLLSRNADIQYTRYFRFSIRHDSYDIYK